MGALFDNLSAIEREKQRRNARMAEDPEGFAYSFVNATPGWDAFFGKLHDYEDAGYNVRARFNPSDDGPDWMDPRMRGYLPGDNQVLNEIGNSQRVRAQIDDERQRQMLDQRQRQLIADQEQSYNQQVSDSLNAPPIDQRPIAQTTQPNGTVKYSQEAAPLTREAILNRVPLPIRAQYAAQFAAQDEQQAKTALTQAQADAIPAKQALDEFTAGYGSPTDMTVDASRPEPKTANTVQPRTGLTPNALYQNGVSFALTGQMPTMGMGGKGQVTAARMAIQNKAGAIAAAAGVDIPTLRAEYKANAGTLSKLMPQAQATANAANTATDNLQLALEESPKISRTDSKWVNSIAQNFVKGATSAEGLSRFETLIYTAAREYAKVTSGGAASSQGLTDSAAKEAEKLLNAAQSPDAFKAAVQAMQDDMANVTRRQAEGLGKVSSSIAQFYAAANGVPMNAPAPVATPAPQQPGGRGGGPQEGAQQAIPGVPGGVAEFRGGKWIRVK